MAACPSPCGPGGLRVYDAEHVVQEGAAASSSSCATPRRGQGLRHVLTSVEAALARPLYEPGDAWRSGGPVLIAADGDAGRNGFPLPARFLALPPIQAATDAARPWPRRALD